MNKVLSIPQKEHIKNGIYYVPFGIEEIAEATFLKTDFVYDIAGLILPEGLKIIGNWAFFDCLLNITELRLPSTLEKIGDGAIWGLDSLKSVYVNSKIISMGSQAFCNCNELTVYFHKEHFMPEKWSGDWNPNCKVSIMDNI